MIGWHTAIVNCLHGASGSHEISSSLSSSSSLRLPPPPTPPSPPYSSVYKFILFIYFWLRWVFVNVRGLSLVAASRGATLCCAAQASHCGGFSCCGAPALGAWASVVMARGLSSCGLRAVERRAVAL